MSDMTDIATPVPRRTGAWTGRFIRRIECWRLRRRTRFALSRLDARLLADAGLSEPEAAAEASKPFWRR